MCYQRLPYKGKGERDESPGISFYCLTLSHFDDIIVLC